MSTLDHLLWSNPAYVDAVYEQYLEDATSVDPSWAAFFAGRNGNPFDAPLPTPSGGGNNGSNGSNGNQQFAAASDEVPVFLTNKGGIPQGVDIQSVAPGIHIYDLVHTYREYGHLIADTDPLGRSPRSHPFLAPEEFAFGDDDLDSVVTCNGFPGLERGTVSQYLEHLRKTYCGPIGVEYMEISNKDQRDWLQSHMEPVCNTPEFSADQKRNILRELVEADSFEEQLQRMYPGAKRFSLEGGTSLITLMHELARTGMDNGLEQMVLGMAHRGRLNVLAQFMGKPLEHILAEFEGRPQEGHIQGYGDVKYHAGYSSDYTDAQGRSLHLSMAFNPSHLEIIDPVVEGIVRAKQDQLRDEERTKVCPVLLHGDAAFCGQGVVAETFTLAGLDGYRTGGTIHIIVNNQVGFTASPHESRSTRYCTDIAHIVRIPVFHVNADYPEAVAFVAKLAMAYRQYFQEDVVIDLVCFRRHGHNELDDASFTQPQMVALLKQHDSVSKIYGAKLEGEGVVTGAERKQMDEDVRQRMRDARDSGKQMASQAMQTLGGSWTGIKTGGTTSASTAMSEDKLELIGRALSAAPDGFNWHKRLKRLMKARSELITEHGDLDWGAGEALALGSLLLDGTPVRFSGQDAGRGTFSHRHAVYTDQQTGERYIPLQHLAEDQGRFEIINSPLSEEAVLGFEYGYSSADPWSLVIWEAQFGDFANGAQVVIDQLIATCEYKWNRMSGIVMLLPHGYEGQGPEHSSARLERYLELCAEHNLQVCNLTTPAQLFHALRRQVKRDFRKPLVIMSPKSLLRHPEATSKLAEFADGSFQLTIDDPEIANRDAVDRVLLCSGKVYYNLSEAREKRDVDDVALVRVEQLYPFPVKEVTALLRSYPKLTKVIWVQEEPRNMGGYRHLTHHLRRVIPEGVTLEYAGRDSRAATATGSLYVHRAEETKLMDLALSKDATSRVVRRKELDG